MCVWLTIDVDNREAELVGVSGGRDLEAVGGAPAAHLIDAANGNCKTVLI